MDADRRHRILMTADTVGGVWQYALELCRGLVERGDEVALATLGRRPTADQRREAAAIPGLQLHESDFKLEWMERPWTDVERAGDWLLSLADRFQPTLVHLNDYSHADLPWNVPVLVVGHSCVLSWWQAVHGGPAPAEWDRYRERVTAGLHAADLVVAPSRAMLSKLSRHYGPLPAGRVIPNGRTRAVAAPVVREPVVLAAGRLWDEGKNIGALAAVAPHLPWPVCIAGEDRHPDGGEADLPNVRPLGRLDAADMAGWFARASIYALPARYEPFGLSALEAAQAGCALVLGDIPSLREVWADAAVFVPPEDHAELEAALCRLIQDPELRAYHARRARHRASIYTAVAMVDDYRNAYDGLCAQRVPVAAVANAARVGVVQ